MSKRNGFKIIPKEERLTGLLLSDDIRMPSGVGTMSKEIAFGTVHRFNWIQVGGAIEHPEKGKIVDVSQDVQKETGIDDAFIKIYPVSGYGNQELVRYLMNNENPDFFLHYTDPRFWIWLYQMEHEIRQNIPIFFYHVWDDLPFPQYNQWYYESCDLIVNISKQTYNIVENVWTKDKPEDWQITYVPHGINEKYFYPITEDEPGRNVYVNEDDEPYAQIPEDVNEEDLNMKTEFELLKDFRSKLLP